MLCAAKHPVCSLSSWLARLAAVVSRALHVGAPRLPNHWVVPTGNSKPLRAQPVRYQLHSTIYGCILWVHPPQQQSSRQDEAPDQELLRCWFAVHERGSHGRQQEMQADGEEDLRGTMRSLSKEQNYSWVAPCIPAQDAGHLHARRGRVQNSRWQRRAAGSACVMLEEWKQRLPRSGRNCR